MRFDSQREDRLMAKALGLILFYEDDLPEFAPDFPVYAYVILRERTYPDKLNSARFAATGHTHYAWAGTWEEKSVPEWIPFIRDYREFFEIFPVFSEAQDNATRLRGKVALANLNSKKIVASHYGSTARALLKLMSAAENRLMSSHQEFLSNPKLIHNRHHIEGVADALKAIEMCYAQIANLAFPRTSSIGHEALLSFGETMANAADLYRRFLLANEIGNFEEAQHLLRMADHRFQLSIELYKRAAKYLDW